MSQKDRIREAYERLKSSTEHDYQRVIYEVPHANNWQETEGYLAEAKVSGEAAVKVVTENRAETIPWGRVVRIHTTVP